MKNMFKSNLSWILIGMIIAVILVSLTGCGDIDEAMPFYLWR